MTDIKDIIRIAIKSEVDAAENYRKAAEQTKIFLLRDKFKFLQNEEVGHRNLLENLFRKKFTDEEIILPDDSEMPFPSFEVTDNMQLSEILKNSMEAERIASEFYRDMGKEADGDEEKAMAKYLSSMEESHYYLLKSELEIAYNFELYDEVHDMMHVGP
jgi:rubrerythrin